MGKEENLSKSRERMKLYKQRNAHHEEGIQQGMSQSIENIGPSIVGLVAGVVTEQPWVGILAKQITNQVAAPIARGLTSFSRSGIGGVATRPYATLMRTWLENSPDPVAKAVSGACLKLNEMMGSEHFDMISFLGGELAPATQVAFWNQVAKFTSLGMVKDADLSNLMQDGKLTEQGAGMIEAATKQVMGEHYVEGMGRLAQGALRGDSPEIENSPEPEGDSPHL